MVEQTKAEQVYLSAYSHCTNPVGIPDRKITHGFLCEGQTILSLGSGDCSDIWFLTESNEIHAIDGSSSAIEVAKAHGIIGVVGNLESKLPYQDNRFDLVICKDLLEHLIGPERLLSEINRVMKRSGRLIVSVPNHFYLPFRIRILFGRNLLWKSFIHDHSKYYDEWNYMHLRFFTYKGFLKFLHRGGFRVDKAFWDFGVLAHYSSPDLYYDHFREKFKDMPLTPKAKIFKYVIMPIWALFNMVFPRSLRHAIVSLSPGLLCAGFYLRCVKK